MEKLSGIACTKPHAAYTAFVHGVKHKYSFIMRTIPKISTLLKPLDEAIKKFIKIVFQGYSFNETERSLLSLPAKFGGMGIIIPSEIFDTEYSNSIKITKRTTEKVLNKENFFVDQTKEVSTLKSKIRADKKKRHQSKLDELKSKITSKSKLKAIEACNENAASIWLTVLPLKRNGFFLAKQAFWDALKIRYDIPLDRVPKSCVCGHPFDLQHAFSCHKGGLMINRHNELRDITVEILREICPNVVVEPALTPLTGEQIHFKTSNTADLARSDISAKDFWIKGQVTYCDVRVFNPISKCHLNQSLSAIHKRNESEKRRQYNQRILQVEHGSFSPLVFSCFGGMSRECSRFFSHASEQLSEKRKISNSSVSALIKARLNFALLRSCLLRIRGSRTSANIQPLCDSDLSLVMKESNIDY